MPNHLVLRPADGNEVAGAYAAALSNPTKPVTIALSRQTLANQAGSTIAKTLQGAYVLLENEAAIATLIATGSEVQLCMAAAATMGNVRVVSMPCWELFEEQDEEYQRSVLGNVPVVSVEAGSTTGWSRYSHAQIGMTSFGASAPGADCFKHFGFSVENIQAKVAKVTTFYASGGAPRLMARF